MHLTRFLPTRFPQRSTRARPPQWLGRVLLCALLPLALGGCSTYWAEGISLEAQERWEEAAIAYHRALTEDPEDPEIQEALERVNKVVARDNFERYKAYVADKAFLKAYERLIDASRQDPGFAPVQEERAKWVRVLVGGQVAFNFENLRANVGFADELHLVVRFNTPNPGEVIEAEINPETGMFFVEDLLYDRPDEMLTYYTLNSIGVSLYRARSTFQRFSTRNYQRFITFRTPILDGLDGQLVLGGNSLQTVQTHRQVLERSPEPPRFSADRNNPHYTLQVQGDRLLVSGDEGKATDFTPSTLYINKKDGRLFVDFGRYELRLTAGLNRWSLARLPLGEEDYFPSFSDNIALQPYFFFREGVFVYVPAQG